MEEGKKRNVRSMEKMGTEVRVEQKRERAIAYTWELCSLRMGNAVRSMTNEKFCLPVLPLLYFVPL